jgi:hypothetical protein
MTWAESIENASESQQRGMVFGPYFVDRGNLATIESLVRTPKSANVPTPWPIAPATGWVKHQLDADYSSQTWCAHGADWVFGPPAPGERCILHIWPKCNAERRASIVQRLDQPFQLIATGEAFAYCDVLFVIPEEAFVKNFYVCRLSGREPLTIFRGFRGHPRQYPEVITPGVYRAYNEPNEESARCYRRKVRIAANVVKQAVFERKDLVLTNLQARGVLQHYGIIEATDVLDLTYDVNVAKWFALNEFDSESGHYRSKSFVEHEDPDRAYDEHSVVYTVIVRAIETYLDPISSAELAKYRRLNFEGWQHRHGDALLPRNLIALWSTRATRQSGFGLIGIGPREDDAWGSVLAIYEHAFHPTFSPHGWDRIGGPALVLGGQRYWWDDDSSNFSDHALPMDDECIQWIRAKVIDLEYRLDL